MKKKSTIVWVDLEGKFLSLLIQAKEKYKAEYGLFDASGVLGVPVGFHSSRFFLPSLTLILNLDDKCFKRILRNIEYGDFNSIIKAIKKAKCRYEDYEILMKILRFKDLISIERELGKGVFMLPYFSDRTLRFAYALALYFIQYTTRRPLLFLMEEPCLLSGKKYIWNLLTSPPNHSLYLHLISIEQLNKIDLTKYRYLLSPSKTSPIVGRFLQLGKIMETASFERKGRIWHTRKIKWEKAELKVKISDIEKVKKEAEKLTRRFYKKPPKTPLVDAGILDLSMKAILYRAILNLVGAYIFQYINIKTGFLVDKFLFAFKIFEWARKKVESSEKE